MAKFALLFVAIFCIVQLSLAARVSRESGAETTTENFLDTLTKGLAQLQNQLQNQVETTFTKENADKALKGLSDLVETAKAKGGELYTNLQNLAESGQPPKKD